MIEFDNNLSEHLKSELQCHGSDIVGFGDLTELPVETREGLPTGISIAVKYPKDTIRGIHDLPTQEYYDQYNLLNKKLNMLVTLGAKFLESFGYRAVGKTGEAVNQTRIDFYTTLLPHKTVATRAGIGWIGKCALLITEEFGSMIRLSSILTDAPLQTASPVNESRCGDCAYCTDACPGKAISGLQWHVGVKREELVDVLACHKAANERTMRSIGVERTICGKCIEVCPYTQRYLMSEKTGENKK